MAVQFSSAHDALPEPTHHGSRLFPRHYDGPGDQTSEVNLHRRFFTYQVDDLVVAGSVNSVLFAIDIPACNVRSFFKDFNTWQNGYDHFYSGIVGDLKGQTFALGPRENFGRHRYTKVIPEHLIVVFEPSPEDGSTAGISPGSHVFMLQEHGGKTPSRRHWSMPHSIEA